MAVKLFTLISTYRERELLRSCFYSARFSDKILVYEGRTNSDKESVFDGGMAAELRKFLLSGMEKPPRPDSVVTVSGHWSSDAEKRTSMLKLAKSLDPSAWILWLDGDEVLLWGEFLREFCERADHETATGGTTIRLVEYDGSVAQCYGKLIKASTVKRYVMSSYEVELENGMTVALPNVPICTMGGIPFVTDEVISRADDERLATHRPPLQGEPHLLHRHGLRDPNRDAQRLHHAEAESFATLVKDAGLESVDNQTAERNEVG